MEAALDDYQNAGFEGPGKTSGVSTCSFAVIPAKPSRRLLAGC
jgi:hypothetical protein